MTVAVSLVYSQGRESCDTFVRVTMNTFTRASVQVVSLSRIVKIIGYQIQSAKKSELKGSSAPSSRFAVSAFLPSTSSKPLPL